MRRFYAPQENFTDTAVVLGPDETVHLRDVLRLDVGAEIAVFNGGGGEYRCRITELEKRATKADILATVEASSPESRLGLTLAVAILRHDRFDLVIQKAVELGVSDLIPLVVKRFDVPLREAVKRTGRWKRIALEATKQSGRARLMRITGPIKFAELINSQLSAHTLMFSERSGKGLPLKIPQGGLTAIVGPVGGWDDSELELAASRGIPIVTLGGRILRAETAAISITTILQHRFGDLN